MAFCNGLFFELADCRLVAPAGRDVYSTGCQPGDGKALRYRRGFRAPEELPERGVAAGPTLF